MSYDAQDLVLLAAHLLKLVPMTHSTLHPACRHATCAHVHISMRSRKCFATGCPYYCLGICCSPYFEAILLSHHITCLGITSHYTLRRTICCKNAFACSKPGGYWKGCTGKAAGSGSATYAGATGRPPKLIRYTVLGIAALPPSFLLMHVKHPIGCVVSVKHGSLGIGTPVVSAKLLR